MAVFLRDFSCLPKPLQFKPDSSSQLHLWYWIIESSQIFFKTSSFEDIQTGKKRKLKNDQNSSSKKKRKLDNCIEFEPFDQTCMHPESYGIARRVLSYLGTTSENIGTVEMANLINGKIQTEEQLKEVADKVQVDMNTLSLILDGLKQTVDQDLRKDFQKPIFKSEILSEDQLKVGLHVEGVVRNTTAFGVFVDIGVKNNGLIHKSQLGSINDLGPGDEVECRIINLELNRNRIGLTLIDKKSKAVSCL